jgi:hypothetical protein
MTKYVVNSGSVKNYPEKANEFFTEIVKGLGSKPKILLCFFATLREYWEEKYKENLRVLPDFFQKEITPSFELAFPDSFEKQIKESNVVYIHGGDDYLVQYWLKKFDLSKIWKDKVIATSSVASHAISKQFWTCDWRKCMDGLGVLPIKFLGHFNSEYGLNDPRGPIDWNKAYKELENYGDKNLPIYALEEGDYKVFEI